MSEKMREALKRLADACDVVGVKYFDTDTMDDEVQVMQAATRDARAALAEQPAQGEAAANVAKWDEHMRVVAELNAARATIQKLTEQPAQGKRAYYETHEPPHCPTCGCGLDAPPAPSVPADWPRWVSSAYQTLRKHNSSIPDDVLDQMRDMLAAAPAVPHG